MVVVIRFRDDDAGFVDELQTAKSALAACAGYEFGAVGRNVDDPSLWTLVTHWRDTGSYRRALSSYDVKLNAVPILSRALDEPTAYETAGDGPMNEAGARVT